MQARVHSTVKWGGYYGFISVIVCRSMTPVKSGNLPQFFLIEGFGLVGRGQGDGAFDVVQFLFQTIADHDHGIFHAERALEIARNEFPPDHPEIAVHRSSLAQLLKASNRPAEAEPLMRDALRICHAGLGPEHPNSVLVSQNLDFLLAEIDCRACGFVEMLCQDSGWREARQLRFHNP